MGAFTVPALSMYNACMKQEIVKTKTSVKLPAMLLAGSFSLLLVLSSLTNPRQDIVAIPLFFLLIWLTVYSLILLFIGLVRLPTSTKTKTWVGLAVTFLVVFLMLKSTGEVKPLDILVLLLLGSGLSLYINRRL